MVVVCRQAKSQASAHRFGDVADTGRSGFEGLALPVLYPEHVLQGASVKRFQRMPVHDPAIASSGKLCGCSMWAAK
jgi:hypothetical protein